MKKMPLCLILALIILLTCSCSGAPKEAVAECSECGNNFELYKKSEGVDGCPVYSTAGKPCPDCVTKDVIDWIDREFVCIDREDWEEFYEQYGYTDAYAKAEAGSVSFSYPSYYDIQEWLSED